MNKLCLLGILALFLNTSTQANYWQQEVNYKLFVSLDTANHTLQGRADFEYRNNSPDTLSVIYFHCWPNAYSSNKTPLAKQLVSQEELWVHFELDENPGGMSGFDFEINGKHLKSVAVDEFSEILLLQLPEPLLPNEKVNISTEFLVSLPKAGVSRLGYVDQDYFISQWYPKPAVYDNEGWHLLSYLDQGEFFSELGRFDVKIDVPKGHIVAASGSLISCSQAYESNLRELKKRSIALIDDTAEDDSSVVKIGRNVAVDSGISAKMDQRDTLTFSLEKAHDFAWFASPDFLLLEKELSLPGKGDLITMSSYFKEENIEEWQYSVDYIEKALLFYSDQIGTYPYTTCTAVDGTIGAGGGMEYPTITVVENPGNDVLLEEVIVHEVGHNWFYGILASNERAHPWMDEGLNSTYEAMYMNSDYAGYSISEMFGTSVKKQLEQVDDKQYLYHWYAYAMDAAKGLDQAGNLSANHYKNDAYASVVYAKSSVVFNYLRNYIGNENFEDLVKGFYQKWKFKHPSPKDFFTELEAFEKRLNERASESKEQKKWDLSWVEPTLYSNQEVDYKIVDATYGDDSTLVILENNGKLKPPVLLDFIEGDSIVYSYWIEGFVGTVEVAFESLQFDQVEIDADLLSPEVKRSNNTYYDTWLLPRSEPLTAHFLVGPDIQDERELFYVPYVGYTSNDKFKLGLVLYNSALKQQDLRYLLMPSYSFGPNKIGGYYQLLKSFDFDGSSSVLNLALKVRREQLNHRLTGGYFQKIEPALKYKFDQSATLSKILDFRYVSTSVSFPGYEALRNEYLIGELQVEKEGAIFPFISNFTAELINYDFAKVSLEHKQSFYLNDKLDKVDLRLFGGLTLGQGDLLHRWRLTAGSGSDALLTSGGEIVSLGAADYTYDEVFLARYDHPLNALSQQVITADGAFRTGLVLGNNSDWMAAMNLTLPTPLPFVHLYGDLGFFPGLSGADNAYTVGAELSLVDDLFEVYFPLYNSANITANFEAVGQTSYAQQIRFKLSLSELYYLWD